MKYKKVLFFILIIACSLQSAAQGKNYIKGLKGIDSLSINRVWTGSVLLPGYGQAYNKQYWKIPVIYGGAAALIYGGAYSNSQYNKTGKNKYLNQARIFYAGAGLMYIGSVIDALSNYKSSQKVIPAKATFLSTMLPGMGQAYNGDYWKIPVIYGGFAFLGYWYDLNQMQYKRYKKAYNMQIAYEADNTLPPSEFNGRLSSNGIKSYRDNARRNRDYATLYLVLWYGINIIDANVFAHLSTFDVGDNLAFKVSPVIIPETQFASNNFAIGLTLKMNFLK